MKTFRIIGMALVAIVLTLSLSSCEKDDDNFIPIDHSKDLVGTWTLLQPGLAEALVISADGSVVSTGLRGNEYWEDVKGTVNVENNKINMEFEDGDKFDGRFEMVPGEMLFIVKSNTGEELTYSYCKQDLSDEIIGLWICNQVATDIQDNMMILDYMEDGKFTWTGVAPKSGQFVVESESTYKVVGDLIIIKRIKEEQVEGVSPYGAKRLTYTPDGTNFGDIMTYTLFIKKGNESMKVSASHLRLKEELNLPGQKYDYIKSYITNVKGLDKDFNAGGFIFNFAKLDGVFLDKMLKTLLFSVEFPDANTIQYRYTYNGETVTASAPIEVDGNKMTVRIDQTRGYFRDIDLYTFQDKDNSQMHIYMSKYAFINYFGNIAVSLLAETGQLDPNDQAAVDAVFDELSQMIQTINVSLVMGKSK